MPLVMLPPRHCSFSLVVASLFCFVLFCFVLFRFVSFGDDHEHMIAGCGEKDCFLSI